MAIDASRLRIIIETQNVAGAARELQGLGAQVDATGKRAQGAAQSYGALGKATQQTGQQAGVAGKQVGALGGAFAGTNAKAVAMSAGMIGGAAGVAAIGSAAVKTGIEFESAMAGVAKTVDATDAELKTLEAGIRDMATSMPMAASEIAGLAEAAGALGVAKEDIMEFTRVTALIGVTTDVTSDQAATSLGQLSNVLNLTADDYERFASTLVQLGNNGASTESAILGITTRIGAATELIGFATDETLGWSSAVANLGMETQAAGGSLQTFFVKSAQLIAEAGDELDTMAETAGMTAEAFQQAYAQDSSAALQTFISGLGELSEAQQLATLSALGFSDINIGRMLLGLAGNTDNLTDSLANGAKGWQENTAAAAESEVRFKTTASQIQIMKNNLDDAAISMFALGEASGGTNLVLETLGGTSEFIRDVALALEWAADAADDLPDKLPDWMDPGNNPYGDRIRAGWASIGTSIGLSLDFAKSGAIGSLYDLAKGVEDTGNSASKNSPAMNQFAADIKFVTERAIENRDAMQNAGQGFNEFANESEIAARQVATATQQELARMFELDPQMGAEFAGEIATMVTLGAMEYRAGLEVLSGLPAEILIPELQALEGEIKGKLFNALISGEDATAARQQLADVQRIIMDSIEPLDLVADTAGEMAFAFAEAHPEISTTTRAVEQMASAGMGFNEFATAGEEALYGVTMAAHGLQEAVSGLSGAYSIGLDVQAEFTKQGSEYGSQLSTIEKAYEAVQKKVEEGIELTEDEILLYEHGAGAIDTFTDAQHDSEVQAANAAIANAELVEAQWELNDAILRNEDDLQPYLDRVKDAEQFARDMGLATDGNTGAQDLFISAIDRVVERLDNLLEHLGYIPPEVELNILLNDEGAYTQAAAFRQAMKDNPATIDLFVNQINQMGFTENNAQGGVMPQGGWSWVGEEGRELMYVPPGGQVFNHHTSNEMAQRLPGFAQGTGSKIDLTDGERQAIRILGEMDVVITPESMAQADAELAALLDARAMAVELGLGDAIIAQLDEDIAAKQGELDLIGRIAGSAWGEGFLSELEAVDATEAMAGLLGDFSLEDIISGQAGTDLGQQFVDLLQLEKIATEMGDLDLAAMYREQADTVAAELERLGQVSGTAYVQGQIDAYNAEQVAAEWDARLADALAGPSFGAGIQSSIDEMDQKIDLGILMGAPMDVIEGWQAERDQMVAEGQAYWKDVTEGIAAGAFSPEEIAAFAEAGGAAFMDAMEETFSPEAIEHILNPINEISEAGYDALMDMFGDAPELAEGFIDDIVAGLYDGTFDYEQAMALLGQAGSDALIPGLEAIEKQLTVDLVNAIIAGNAELEADILEKLALLDQLQSELDLTTQAAERYVRGTSGIYYDPATTGMGGAGSGGGGGMGGSGGGYGGPNVQSSGGGTFEDDYVFNIGPDTAWAQSDPQMYQFTAAGQTLLNKFGLDLAHEGGPDAFASQAEYLYYIAERVNRHVQNYPHLIDNEEFWKHVQTMGNGWLTKDKILNISNLSVEDRGESLVYIEGKKDLSGLGTVRSTSSPTGGSGGVRGFADGGIITSPLFGLVGEAGPEMVQPLKQGHPERERLIADIASAVIQSTGGGATFVVDGKVFHETVGKRAMHSINGRVR